MTDALKWIWQRRLIMAGRSRGPEQAVINTHPVWLQPEYLWNELQMSQYIAARVKRREQLRSEHARLRRKLVCQRSCVMAGLLLVLCGCSSLSIGSRACWCDKVLCACTKAGQCDTKEPICNVTNEHRN